jgi:uncharacterized ion transporter superfamily protein YfcC
MSSKSRVPHTLVLMLAVMTAALVLTWILPAGRFATETTASGHRAVIPGTFTRLEDSPLLMPWHLVTVVPRAMVDAGPVIFFVLIAGGVVAVLRKTGAVDAAIDRLLRRSRERLAPLLFGTLFTFGLLSATVGMGEEYLALLGTLVLLCAALRLDAVTAVGILMIGHGVGFAVAPFNPFTVLVAQRIAGLPPGSGAGYRLLLIVPMFAVAFHYLYRYAAAVRADPGASVIADLSANRTTTPLTTRVDTELTTRRKLVLLACAVTLAALVWGIVGRGWYLQELSALLLALGIVTVIIARLPSNDAANAFTAGAAELAGTALLVGLARSIVLILEDGAVLDTVINGVAWPLSHVPAEASAVGMLLAQSALDFFIPSGSGHAFATMPVLAPVGDLVGVSRQVTVLAFQLGDGLMNMIIPTNPVLMAMLGAAGVPYGRWLRFIGPLLVRLLAVSAIALVLAVAIGYR